VDGSGGVFDWLWLAMANHRLGRKAVARKWLDQAVRWMEKQKPSDVAEGEWALWSVRVELQLLRREAEALLSQKPDGPPP
jgi:hypothetical protein